MKIHQKYFYCQGAEIELHGRLTHWLNEVADLTWSEAVRQIAGLIAHYSKHPVNEERHSDDDEKLHSLLIDWLKQFPELTWAEAVRCIATIVLNWSGYPVREERHPDNDEKKADEA
jgi:hypothetical protein